MLAIQIYRNYMKIRNLLILYKNGGTCPPLEHLSACCDGEWVTIPGDVRTALHAHLASGCERCRSFDERVRRLTFLTTRVVDASLAERLWSQLERDQPS
jgi:hypothetical protein